MRKALIASLVLVAATSLAVAATATGARGGAAGTAAIPGCAKGSLNLLLDGTLTVGADNPAFPPWFGGTAKKPWEVSDPYSGQGYESAVVYAIAKQLGFKKGDVVWTYVPFNNSYRPGKKPFDFYITQVSVTPERAKAVDFSRGYYFVNQSVVARKGTPIARAKSIQGLRPYRLGAQVGTTSYSYIVDHIRPRSVSVYDDNDKAIQALNAGQIDGIVVDLPTAFYVVAVQLDDGVIVGKLPTKGTKERFGLVFQKGNPLRGCVNRAIGNLWANGTIKRLQNQYLAKAGAPDLR
jgi:polar amino acid transport system substrate-binding protein